MPARIYKAPPGTGTAVLGRTLPQLMYDASARYDNLNAFNQRREAGWQPFSLDDFRRHSEETALGLRALGVDRGDKVSLYMESDVYFCIADMGCLIAGLIDVPIYLTHEPEQIQYVIEHSESEIVVVSGLGRLGEIQSVLANCPSVQTVVVTQVREDEPLSELSDGYRVMSLGAVRDLGRQRLREDPEAVDKLLGQIDPEDLATIIYTSGTTGRPKGVMLSHQNITYNALTAFTGLPEYETGPDGERTISFLPLSHVFARALHYGYMYHGTSVYFTTPEELSADLKEVRPTLFISVPRLLEKVYGTILERIGQTKGLQNAIGNWSLRLAERYNVGSEPTGLYRWQLALADRLVFKKWRAALGGKVKYVIAGGAALSPRLTNLFAAAGVTILQGYGLTETSPVIAFNRPGRNRAGSVGEPMPGLEVAIADDGEIMTRGPHVMMGYYKDEERTRDAIDEEGWFHTGDIGEFSDDGYLRITDRKKDLFKLSTGKYVMPQPLENKLTTNPLVEQVVVVGSGYKFCTALVFPDQDKLKRLARSVGLDPSRPVGELTRDRSVQDRFRRIVESANEGMDHWSRIKRFRLLAEHLTPENGRLTPTMKVRRGRIQEEFADQIEAMYDEAAAENEDVVIVEHPEQHVHA